MQKVSLGALALLATTVAASAQVTTVAANPANCPKAFQGFWLTGNTGFQVGTGKDSFEDDSQEQVFKGDLGFKGFDGGVGVGYLHRVCNWGLGLNFNANWTSAKGKERFGSEAGEDEDGNPTFASFSEHKAHLQNSLQVYAKLGYVICGQAMPYVGLGWDNSRWEHKFVTNNGTTSDSDKKKKRHNSLLWTAGVDLLATKHVVVGLQYTGTAGKKEKVHVGSDESGSIEFTDKFNPLTQKVAFTVGIVY